MNVNLIYFIDDVEVRLKSAKAAHDWKEVDTLYKRLQELYSMQKVYSHTAVAH